jgi:hypothetical protein
MKTTQTLLATLALSAGLFSAASVQAATYSYDSTGTFTSTFNQSWSAQVDVNVPLSLDSLIAPTEWYAEALIGVIANASDGTQYTFANGLEIGTNQNPHGRKFNPEYFVNGGEIGGDIGVTPTSVESATLTLSYDAATKTFTAGSHGVIFRTLDATSFSKMQGSDEMHVLVGNSSNADLAGLTIPAFTLSNFTVTTPVPVPAAAWLLGSGLLGLVSVARRKAA